MTTLTKFQEIKKAKTYMEDGVTYRITATVRHDDRCGNGHNTFSITADIDRRARNNRWVEYTGGCCHDEVSERFPELAPFIKWHLTSTDGPLHYLANTLYWIKQGNLDYARSSAVWPDATLGEIVSESNLRARLPALMVEFRAAVESLGLVY